MDFADLSDNRGLELTNTEFLRKLSIGSDWNTLSIGLNCQFEYPSNDNNILNAQFALGMCSSSTGSFNTTKGFKNVNCKHWIGANFGGSSGSVGTFSYSYPVGETRPFCPAYYPTRINTLVKLTGSIYQVYDDALQSNVNYVYYIPDSRAGYTGGGTYNGPIRRVSTIFRVFKGNNNIYTASCSVPVIYTNNSIANLTAMASQTSPTISLSEAIVINHNSTHTINESTDGYLDTLSIYWNNTTHPLRIYELQVWKLN